MSRHVAECRSCAARAASARSLARLLHSGVDRRTAPARLRERLRGVPTEPAARHRVPVFATAAALLLMLLPLVSDTTPRTGALTEAGMASPASLREGATLVFRRLTGTFVCLECEARSEAGYCPMSHADHATGFCAENGELWRLMSKDRRPDSAEASLGRTATIEGVAFPQSGFLRVSRVGY